MGHAMLLNQRMHKPPVVDLLRPMAIRESIKVCALARLDKLSESSGWAEAGAAPIAHRNQADRSKS